VARRIQPVMEEVILEALTLITKEDIM